MDEACNRALEQFQQTALWQEEAAQTADTLLEHVVQVCCGAAVPAYMTISQATLACSCICCRHEHCSRQLLLNHQGNFMLFCLHLSVFHCRLHSAYHLIRKHGSNAMQPYSGSMQC